MKRYRKIKSILGAGILILVFMFTGCGATEESSVSVDQEIAAEDADSTEKEEIILEDDQHGSVEIKQSTDKYTWYIKDYVGKNVAAFGYTSLGGDRMDHYGDGYLKLILLNEDGSYIDINNDDDLKNYVVTAQNVEPNTELKYTFDDEEEYSSIIYQNIEEIVLAVKKVGSDSATRELTQINVSPDQGTWYIRDYVGRNLAYCGYASMGGQYRDAYGDSTIVFVLMPEDGSYIEPDDAETIQKYVVTGQSVAPNTELKLEIETLTDENGGVYGYSVSSQSIQEIELYLASVGE